jgi:hypothetical protein
MVPRTVVRGVTLLLVAVVLEIVEVDSSLGRYVNGAHRLQSLKEISRDEMGSGKPPPFLAIHSFGVGFAAQEPKDEWSWEYMFHCGPNHFHGPLVLSQAMVILAGLALVVGLIGAFFEYREAGQPVESWGPCVDKLILTGSVYGGVLMYCYDLITDLMVIIGFWFCGYYWWMAFSLLILIGAQIFAAWEFAHEEKTIGEKIKKFIIAICQGHVFVNAHESWTQGRVTAHFARHKFIEAVWEAGPQAVFAVYVLYYLDQRDNFWLIASIAGSVCGLAWGISVWLDFSFNKQLEDDGISPNEFCVRWFHHAMWGGYFAVDFSLRLLTIGLFLSLHNLRPYNQVIFFVLVVVYMLAVLISTQVYNTEAGRETWEILGETVQVQRSIIAQRCIDGLILTFFVHVLPADIRLAPKHHRESRLLFALHPELRAKLMKIIIPLRAADYLGLGFASMYYRWDPWQCAALVSLFVVMHVLLLVVIRAQRPCPSLDRQRSAPNLEDLPPDLQRRLSQMDSQPFIARTETSTVERRLSDRDNLR